MGIGALHTIAGGTVLFGVFTLPRRSHNLDYAYDRLKRVTTRFRRKAKLLETRHGIDTSIRIYEETFSIAKLWHPHVNMFWLMPANMAVAERDSFMEKARELWVECAALEVRGTSVRAQRLDFLNTASDWNRACSYAFKHAYYFPKPSSAYNITSSTNLKPWEILDLALSGDAYWQRVWNEFELATKRFRRSTVFSNN